MCVQNWFVIFKQHTSEAERKVRTFRSDHYLALGIGLMEDDEDFEEPENDDFDDDFDQISNANLRLRRKRRLCYKAENTCSSKRVINICSQCQKNCCDNHSTRVCKDCWLKNKRKLEIENRRNLRNFDVEDQSESESDDLE